MVPTSAQDRAAGKDLETEGSRLFVSLECRIDGTLKFAQEVETKEHGQESRLSSEERTQAETVGGQLVLELVDATLERSSAIVIAPDFEH
jgi:hypothetical protein